MTADATHPATNKALQPKVTSLFRWSKQAIFIRLMENDMSHFDKNAAVEDYKLRSKRLIIPFSITASVTPASKLHNADVSALVLSSEGKTATAAAIDAACSFTTPVDADGVFGILVYNLGTVDKLYHASLVNTSTGASFALARNGASSSGVTASGNIAISFDTDVDLSSSNLSAHLVIDYKVRKA